MRHLAGETSQITNPTNAAGLSREMDDDGGLSRHCRLLPLPRCDACRSPCTSRCVSEMGQLSALLTRIDNKINFAALPIRKSMVDLKKSV
jgi:hypothetical protein